MKVLAEEKLKAIRAFSSKFVEILFSIFLAFKGRYWIIMGIFTIFMCYLDLICPHCLCFLDISIFVKQDFSS
jgi:uncharacterized membrane protein